ncbi:MAG: alpha/beta fold hydrolase [Actinophytocola sp.]|uniref:alpha/beta fold hydrolase n=1 Tax=Actinophytocola sp. TaxID=1872138 RepID=UPI0013267BEA|nr:alpha/beta hydrolase [Actinophytocola sp.]MPZ84669.1 alpha/beta fold hydrolase [Actinophytocola sp.]
MTETASETDLALADGRTLHVYDTGPDSGDLAVFWHHGTPNIGAPPKPLFPVAAELGIRWVAHDRPGYGGSTPVPGRDLASAAADVASAADALGIDRFAVMGHSGGGSHALGCGALLPDRVLAVVSAAGMAPFDADGLDWFAGMSEASVGSLGSAAEGRAAKERYEAAEDKPEMEFAPADLAAFDGAWAWFGEVVGPAVEPGPAALIDDDLAYVARWGFDPATISAPVLLLHGGMDRVIPASHAGWLADHCPTAELRVNPYDGHISVLNSGEAALRWLAEQSRRRRDPERPRS